MLMDCSNVLDERIDPFELDRLRENYERQLGRGEVAGMAKLSYAHGLIRSTKHDVHQGIAILDQLCRDDNNDREVRIYVYYLAIAHARLKDYDRALTYIDSLLLAEKENRQALSLKEVIEKKMRNEGLIGAAILGGGGALIVGAIAAILFAAKK